MYWLHRNWNNVFWLLFIATLLMFVLTGFGYINSLDVMFGFIIVVMGVGKLSEELLNVRHRGYSEDIYDKLHHISTQLERNFSLLSDTKKLADARVFSLDKKRVDMSIKIDENYRDLARKIIEIENRVNSMSKTIERTLLKEMTERKRR